MQSNSVTRILFSLRRHSIYAFFLLLLFFTGCIERRRAETAPQLIEHHIGSTETIIRIISYNKSGYVFVNLHDDETTAETAALKLMAETGGNFVKIDNKRKRNIQFKLGQKNYEFDPNRMFTTAGRVASLKKNGNYSIDAAREVERFANVVLNRISDFKFIIAVHNNTNENYAITDYMKKYKREARLLHINQHMDKDDFVFTTNADLFKELKARNINCVLQNNSTATDDGSLSVYAGRNFLHYVNIETEHGHLEEQNRLIREVVKMIENLD